jgi:hypothetical protein
MLTDGDKTQTRFISVVKGISLSIIGLFSTFLGYDGLIVY